MIMWLIRDKSKDKKTNKTMDTQSNQVHIHNYCNILLNNDVNIEDNSTKDNSSSFTVNN